MANFSQAFGYNFYIVPLGSACVDLSSVVSPALGAGGFIDDSTSLAGSGDVTETGTGGTYVLTIKGVAYSLNGDGTALRLAGLTDAALETDTNSEDVITYDDETKGFSQSVATSKSFTINLAGVSDYNDIGYKVLRIAEKNTVSESMLVKFARKGPKGNDETVFGYGRLTGYTENIEAGGVCAWECSLEGYGPYGLELNSGEGGAGGICDPNAGNNAGGVTGPVASLTLQAAGSGFAEGTYTGVALTQDDGAMGSGTGATADIQVDGSGNIIAAVINAPGTGYKAGELLTTADKNFDTAGSGTGDVIRVQTLASVFSAPAAKSSRRR